MKRKAKKTKTDPELGEMFGSFLNGLVNVLERGRDFEMPLALMLLSTMRVFYEILKQTGRSDRQIRDMMHAALTVVLKRAQGIDPEKEYNELFRL